MLTLVPDPLRVTPPGYRVRVQDPLDGRLYKLKLPVPTEQVGCVILPDEGATGVTGWELITTTAEEEEVQPSSFLTV